MPRDPGTAARRAAKRATYTQAQREKRAYWRWLNLGAFTNRRGQLEQFPRWLRSPRSHGAILGSAGRLWGWDPFYVSTATGEGSPWHNNLHFGKSA